MKRLLVASVLGVAGLLSSVTSASAQEVFVEPAVPVVTGAVPVQTVAWGGQRAYYGAYYRPYAYRPYYYGRPYRAYYRPYSYGGYYGPGYGYYGGYWY